MIRLLYISWIVVAGLVLFQHGYAQDPRQNYKYVIAVNAAYNELEKENYVKAGTLVNNYLKEGYHYADAFLIMAEILLEKKYYQQAERYLSETERSKEYFMMPEQVIRLYWNQVHALNRSEEMDILDPERKSIVFDITGDTATEKKLENILRNIISYAQSRPGDYYQEHLGRAYFMLGRVWYSTRPLKGMETFLLAAKRGFLPKSANLYSAYFFAIQPQWVIDQVYKDSPEGPPQKRRAFLFYYQNFIEGKEDEDFREISIPKPEYTAMKVATEKYFQSLQK